MKKLLFITSSVLLLNSCSKIKCYECTTTVTSTNPSVSTPAPTHVKLCDKSRKEIKAYEENGTQTSGTLSTSTTCK